MLHCSKNIINTFISGIGAQREYQFCSLHLSGQIINQHQLTRVIYFSCYDETVLTNCKEHVC